MIPDAQLASLGSTTEYPARSERAMLDGRM